MHSDVSLQANDLPKKDDDEEVFCASQKKARILVFRNIDQLKSIVSPMRLRTTFPATLSTPRTQEISRKSLENHVQRGLSRFIRGSFL